MSKKQYINQLKKSIENLSKWESSGKAFGHFKKINNKYPDRLYEFYCYIRIIDDLRNSYSVKLIPGTRKIIFPQKSAKKNGGWARFDLKDINTGEILFQICFGTKVKISSSPKTTFAADISFQKSDATNDPDENDVELIMDAKYKESNLTKLDIETIKEFAKSVQDFGVQTIKAKKFKFDNLKEIEVNCLITNGRTIDIHEQYCKNNCVQQVGSFDCDGRKFDVVG